MDEQHEEEVEEVEGTDQSRREFATKLLAVAGAAAAAGLLGSAGSVDAQTGVHKTQTGVYKMSVGEFKLERGGAGMFKLYKSPNGFRITLSGREMGQALRNAGLVGPNANLENATIAIEFTT